MPTGLRRYHQTGDLHAINVNCFRKRAIFDTPEPRDTFVNILEEGRHKYQFQIIGYVVMPTHIHLLVSEPENAPLSTAMQVLKQRFSRTRVLEEHIWEPRYYDFNVFSSHKLIEKLEYIHMNPVNAGLVNAPTDWQWSSYRAHYHGEAGPVSITTL